MKPVLQTARLSFRDFTVDDYDNVHAYGSDPEVTRYTALGPNTPEQTKVFPAVVFRTSRRRRSVRTTASHSFTSRRTSSSEAAVSCGPT